MSPGSYTQFLFPRPIAAFRSSATNPSTGTSPPPSNPYPVSHCIAAVSSRISGFFASADFSAFFTRAANGAKIRYRFAEAGLAVDRATELPRTLYRLDEKIFAFRSVFGGRCRSASVGFAGRRPVVDPRHDTTTNILLRGRTAAETFSRSNRETAGRRGHRNPSTGNQNAGIGKRGKKKRKKRRRMAGEDASASPRGKNLERKAHSRCRENNVEGGPRYT